MAVKEEEERHLFIRKKGEGDSLLPGGIVTTSLQGKNPQAVGKGALDGCAKAVHRRYFV